MDEPLVLGLGTRLRPGLTAGDDASTMFTGINDL